MPLTSLETAGPIIPRRAPPADGALDMTPMIDVTFLLLVFFLVASTPDARVVPDLPEAEHGLAVSKRTALTISVAYVADGSGAAVYLSDLKTGEPVPLPRAAQEDSVRQAAREAVGRGVDEVLIQAERRVRYRDVERIVRAASVPGVSVHLAVMELD